MLAEVCYRRGMDVPIYVTYFKKKDLVYMVDAPILYSELIKNGATRAEIAKRLLDRCNALGKMDPHALPAKEEVGEELPCEEKIAI